MNGQKAAGPKEFKVFAVSELQTLDVVLGQFEGYLSVFRNADTNGDVVEPGAFKKTLREAHETKSRTNSPFLYPVLVMHDPAKPCGGFYEMREDQKGLYVKGQCDLNTELGRMAFSGMQMGYMNQMSIGYDTVKSTRDQKGTRHLLETRLWEGSVITAGFAANPEALVLATKQRAAGRETKSVGGKTTWPLAARDRAWDNGAAHGRIVAWATGADDKLDPAKMKSVCFWVDPGKTDQIGGYKLLFCDVINGDVQAIPRAIMACTGSHGIQGVQGVSSSDLSGIKSKISTYYGRMRKEFNDDSLVPSWESQKMAWRHEVEQKQLGGLQTLTSCLSGASYLYDRIDDLLDMVGDATGLDLDPDEGEENAGDEMAGGEGPATAVSPAVSIMLDHLDGFKDALTALGAASQAFDDALDAALALLGIGDTDEDTAYMRAMPVLETKVGATLSAATKSKLSDVSKGLKDHAKTLDGMLQAPANPGQAASVNEGPEETKTVEPQPESGTTTALADGTLDSLEEPVDDATLTDQLYQALLEQRVTAARLSME